MSMNEQAENNRAVVREWFEQVWNNENLDASLGAVDRLLAADAIGHGLPANEDGSPMLGPTAMKPFVSRFKGAFPDLRVEVEELVSEGDLIVARCRVRGTHTGDGLGLAPTGRPIEITGMTMVRVKDGQIADGWNNFDFQTLFTQIQG